MKISPLARLGAVSALAALTLTGCAANESPAPAETGDATTSAPASALSGNLVGSGASSQQVAIQAWNAEFQKTHADALVEYDPAGSGTGRESFQQGAVNFAGSDRGFKVDEIAKGPFGACAAGSDLVQIPTYISPIAIVFQLDGVDELKLDPATLAGIFAGTITSWDDPAIAATNPGTTLPASAITPVHRSDKSGTTGNFTDYLGKVAGDVWSWGSTEEWPTEITGGEAADKTSGVANAVRGGNGTIGYIDASQASGFSAVAVKVGDAFVAYSAEGAAATLDASAIEEGRTAGDLVFAIDRTTDAPGAYPIILVSYLIACGEYEDANVADLTRAFFSTVISAEGQEAAAKNAGSAPISDALRAQAQTAIDLIK